MQCMFLRYSNTVSCKAILTKLTAEIEIFINFQRTETNKIIVVSYALQKLSANFFVVGSFFDSN